MDDLRNEYLEKNAQTEYMCNEIKLEQVFTKLREIENIDNVTIDTSKYREQFNEIKKNVEEMKKTGGDKINYQKYSWDITNIINEINKKYSPMYMINLHIVHINGLLKDVDERIIDDVVHETRKLIELINELELSEDNNSVILNQAYKTIHDVILNESALDRFDILNEIKTGNPITKEHISKLVMDDLGNLPRNEVAFIELKHSEDGLGYDYLTFDLIKKLSAINLALKRDSYVSRKQTATMEMMSRIDELNKEKKEIDRLKIERRRKAPVFKLKTVLASLLTVAYVALPIGAGIGGGFLISKFMRGCSGTKRVYDAVTNKVIEEPTGYETIDSISMYLDVDVCSPWRENPEGGYIRNVVSYHFAGKKDDIGKPIDELFHKFSKGNEKTETKKVLLPTEETEKQQIIVTEKINDLDNSWVHWAPFSFGFALAFMIVFMCQCGLAADDVIGIDKLESMIRKNIYGLRDLVKWKVIKESYINVGNQTVKLEEEYTDLSNQFTDFEPVITEELVKTAKKYVKR